MNQLVHLCDAPTDTTSDYACTTIRCTANRLAAVEDSNDYSFDTLPAQMDLAIGDAKLLVNMNDSALANFIQSITNTEAVAIILTEGGYNALAVTGSAMILTAAALF